MPPDMVESLRSAINAQPDEQRILLAKLASVTESIEGYKATIFMLERERMQLQTQLRLSGYRAPAAKAVDG